MMTTSPQLLPLASLAAACATAAGAAVLGQAMPPQPGVTRVDLQRHDLSVAGRETVQVRVDFAPGAAAVRHKHPGEEIVYVLEGTLEYQLDDGPAERLEPGDVIFIPNGMPHAVRNVGGGDASELATYVVEKGKPLVIPVN